MHGNNKKGLRMLDVKERPTHEGVTGSGKRQVLGTSWNEVALRALSLTRRLRILEEVEGHLEHSPDHIAKPAIQTWKVRLNLQ